MPYEQREIAFEAKEAAMRCLDVYLRATEFRAALPYAVHESMVTVAFSACYLLKVAILFPTEIDTHQVLSQVEELAGLLSEVAAERYVSILYFLSPALLNADQTRSLSMPAIRYALTLRLMITSFKRRFAMTVPSTPKLDATDSSLAHLLLPGGGNGTGGAGDPFGWGAADLPSFEWPAGMEDFSPNMLPVWLQVSTF